MAVVTLGVDISARWFDVAQGAAVTRYPNTAPGIAACLEWVAGRAPAARIGMEATGTYHLPLATALYEAGHTVFVCNPLSLARYSEALLARTKTDATDARRIAPRWGRSGRGQCSAASTTSTSAPPDHGPSSAPCIFGRSAGRSGTGGCGEPAVAPGANTPLEGGGPAPPRAPQVGRYPRPMSL